MQPDPGAIARLVGDGLEQDEHLAFGEAAFGQLLLEGDVSRTRQPVTRRISVTSPITATLSERQQAPRPPLLHNFRLSVEDRAQNGRRLKSGSAYYLTELHWRTTIKRMAAPISVRLDDDVRATLEADAKEHGIGLATYLRNIATDRAKLVRKAKIREESRRVAEQNRNDTDAREFHDFWDQIARDAHVSNRSR